jgi:hypothetical protein
MTLTKRKKPISRQRKSATPKTTSLLESKADEGEHQLKLSLAFPDPGGPRFGSAFLELARSCELPLGSLGSRMPSELRRLEEAVELFLHRYRHELRESPDSVPGWQLQHTSAREIPNTLAAFHLVEGNPALRDAFLDACKVRITELTKGFAAVQALSPEESQSFVNRFFRELIQFRDITRLARLGKFESWRQEQRLTEGRADTRS